MSLGFSIQVVDLPSLCSLLPIPEPAAAWRSIAGMCGQVISPACRSIPGIFLDDFERVAEVLSEVESYDEEETEIEERAEPAKVKTPARLSSSPVRRSRIADRSSSCSPRSDSSPPERPRRKRRRSSNPHSNFPLVIPSTNPSIPTIVIIPADPSPLPTFGHVPYQDAADGHRLTVPQHPVFNASFPPMTPTPYSLPPVARWCYKDGHWHALLPDLEEQAKKGVYSRALTTRRRPCRRPARQPPSSA
ncbi:hypothetical protein HGRIS_008487 [Hohenbuehelia grisea]|uniref:Uncharacterized protein n=1 Tax=Hohenbuehelia grisea TaxID=104357 RepID=A0ABR3J958_9AGAR